MSRPPSSAANHIKERPRRFYKAAAGAPVEGGFAVQLDGRTAKTPANGKLVVPTESLARLLAEEWEAQVELIDAGAMPATRLAFTAIDRTPSHHEAVARQVAAYAGSDLICYFAEGPPSLLARQLEQWGPWLDWAERELGTPFVRCTGVTHQAQPSESVGRIEVLADELDDFSLSGLAFAAGLLGSAVLALALQRGALTGEDAFALSRLDEAFQVERWGVDEEAAAQVAGRLVEAKMLERWFAALR